MKFQFPILKNLAICQRPPIHPKMGMCPDSYLALFFRTELSALECAKRERFVQIYLAQWSHPKIHGITRQPSSE